MRMIFSSTTWDRFTFLNDRFKSSNKLFMDFSISFGLKDMFTSAISDYSLI